MFGSESSKWVQIFLFKGVWFLWLSKQITVLWLLLMFSINLTIFNVPMLGTSPPRSGPMPVVDFTHFSVTGIWSVSFNEFKISTKYLRICICKPCFNETNKLNFPLLQLEVKVISTITSTLSVLWARLHLQRKAYKSRARQTSPCFFAPPASHRHTHNHTHTSSTATADPWCACDQLMRQQLCTSAGDGIASRSAANHAHYSWNTEKWY